MKTRPRAEWLARFADADVCLTPVLTPADAAARFASNRDRPRASTAAPALGADTDTVLAEAGIDSDARARLRAARVI